MAKRGEKGLTSEYERQVKSAKMERLLKKAEERFGVPFTAPVPLPVKINSRLKRYDGIYRGDHIEVAGYFYDVFKTGKRMKELLFHEALHEVVSKNHTKVNNSYTRLEKFIFQTALNDGSHNSWSYKIVCECGAWVKSTKKKNKYRCNHCGKTLVSSTEYRKLKKIAELKSHLYPIDLDIYRTWKSNKKMEY